LGASLGKGIGEFKKAMAEGGKEYDNALSDGEKNGIEGVARKEDSAK
jgi:Sec-independent protein translocase protein TatA